MDSLRWIILFVAVPAVICADPFRGLGENCTKTCDVLHSVCEDNKCICEKNYFELDGICAAGLSALCYKDNDCKLNNTICSAENRNCKCHPNFVAAPDNSKCLSKLSDECTKADECLAPNSECKDGRCQCLPGRSLVDGECVFKLGSYCEKFGDCGITNSECVEKKCACYSHYFELLGQCVAGLSALCYKDNDCKLNNTICSAEDRNCKCHPNFVAAPDNSKCLSKLGSYCEKFGDCGITNSECVEKKCACYSHYFELLGQCVAGVNASCYNNNQCKAKNSVCLDKKCQCEENFAATPDYQCLPIAQHHKPCKYDSQCFEALPHTSCKVTEEGQRCECADKYFFKEGECYPRKYVSDKCDRWDDCFTPNSYCKNGQCACLPSYKFENEACNNSSIIARPLIYFVGLIVLGMKLLM